MKFSKTIFYIEEKISSHIHIKKRINQKKYQLHSHNFLEIVLVIGGNGIHFHNDRYDLLLPGVFILIEPNEYHEFTEANNLDIINIGLFPSYWQENNNLFINSIKELQKTLIDKHEVIILHGQLFYKVQELIKWAEQEQNQITQENKDDTNQIIYTIINQILILITRGNKQSNSIKNLYYSQNINHDIIDLIWLYQYSSDKINLEKYTQTKGKTYNTFFRKFKGLTSMSPKAVQNNLKLLKAKNIISKNPEIKITELAGLVNYDDISYFSRSFSKYFKTSPQKYKQEVIQKQKNII